jgi:T5SS/PEP-CTERM-associated repeat protein
VVSGQGASWVLGGSLTIGASGSGTLTLANHGLISVGPGGGGGGGGGGGPPPPPPPPPAQRV